MNRSEAGKKGWLKTKQLHEDRHRRFREEYEKTPNKCLQCDKVIAYEKRDNKFCSHSCAAIYNNRGRVCNIPQASPLACRRCGKLLEGRSSQKWCSIKCHKEAAWENTKEKILSTGVLANRYQAKRYLAETRGYQCEICGISEWMGKILTLILDHINGNPYDWSLENLRLLCSNCDSLTPTYKGRNAGNGRHSRRVRYHEGKSY